MTPTTSSSFLRNEAPSDARDSVLSFFEPLTKDICARVESIINEFPLESARAIKACYRARRNENNAFEYGPWLIADLLGVPISERVRLLAVPWFLVHLYTLAVDDLIDTGRSVTTATVIGAGLCLQRGLTSLYDELPELATNPFISRYFQEAAEAALLEFRDHNRSSTDALYKKMAIAKVWATVLLTERNLRQDCIDDRIDALNSILNAMQLRDDLMDWEVDFDAGHITPLLLRAMNSPLGVRLYGKDSLSPQQMGLALLASDAFQEHIVLSNNYFDSALTKATFSGLMGREYIRQRISENRSALKALRILGVELGIHSDSVLGNPEQAELRAQTGLREVIQTNWKPYGCR